MPGENLSCGIISRHVTQTSNGIAIHVIHHIIQITPAYTVSHILIMVSIHQMTDAATLQIHYMKQDTILRIHQMTH